MTISCIICPLAIISYFFIDHPLMIYIHQVMYSAYHGAAGWISYLGKYYIVTAITVCLYILIYYRNSKKLICSLKCVVATFLCASIVYTALKLLLGRARPMLYFTQHITGFHGPSLQDMYHAFPSGHTTMSAAMAIVLSLEFPRFRWLCYAFIILIACARLVALRHHLSDVLIGALIGGISAYYSYYWVFKEKSYTE